MSWLDDVALHEATPDLLASSMSGMLSHMNEDHGHNLLDYARAFGPDTPSPITHVHMIGIDHLGFDLAITRQDTEQNETRRLGFRAPLSAPKQARAALVELANLARAALATRGLEPAQPAISDAYSH